MRGGPKISSSMQHQTVDIAQDMIENERSSAIHTAETVEEGLFIGQVRSMADSIRSSRIPISTLLKVTLQHLIWTSTKRHSRRALEWSMTRGSRSGRVAWQFIQDLAGRMAGGSVSRTNLWRLPASSSPTGAAANLKYWIDRLFPLRISNVVGGVLRCPNRPLQRPALA